MAVCGCTESYVPFLFLKQEFPAFLYLPQLIAPRYMVGEAADDEAVGVEGLL